MVETILRGLNVMWPDLQVDRIQVDKHPVGPEFQRDRTKREQNQELTELIVDTILLRENVMWPDSKVDKIQEDKHKVGQTPK